MSESTKINGVTVKYNTDGYDEMSLIDELNKLKREIEMLKRELEYTPIRDKN